MEKLNKLISSAVPLPIEDIDTDQIIPARFLKAIDKNGFGDNLFRDWRYDKNDQPIADFILNNPSYSGSILLAGKNFGCGSSREHAAWAIYGYGFRVVVSSFFADIFKNNALNNGILPLTVSADELHRMFQLLEQNPNTQFVLDMEAQTFATHDGAIHIAFEIDAYKKLCLINGYDDIDYLLSQQDSILAYEQNRPDVL